MKRFGTLALSDSLSRRRSRPRVAAGLRPEFGHTPNASRMIAYAAIPTPADAGIVMIHAQKILRATPHRTADKRFVAPTPMIAEAITWVVLTGIPASALLASAMPPPVSAEKPCQGRKCVTRCDIVRTIRQPPKNVPSEMEAWAPTMTQNGTANWPDGGPHGGPIAATTRMRVMIPIPFWASFVPCVTL